MIISVMKCNSINESVGSKYQHFIFDVFFVFDTLRRNKNLKKQRGKIWIDCIEIC
jgi:hypothetical protein